MNFEQVTGERAIERAGRSSVATTTTDNLVVIWWCERWYSLGIFFGCAIQNECFFEIASNLRIDSQQIFDINFCELSFGS